MGLRAPRSVRGQRRSRLVQQQQLGAHVDTLLGRRDAGGGIARTAGRAALWGCVGLLLVRGVGDVLADPQPATTTSTVRGRAARFPDSDALAFAAGFARAYLTSGATREKRLASYFATSLSDQATPKVSPRSPGAEVADATVAREVSLGDSRALITVASFMRDGRTRYLTVPVARDEHGGLVVYDLPSFSAPPVAGATEAPATVPLSGQDGEAVGDLTRRFLRAYLHGEDESALAYFLAPGVHVASIDAGLTVEQIEEVGLLDGDSARVLHLAVTALVREQAAGATYRQRYRVTVERLDRWYVTAVAGGPRS